MAGPMASAQTTSTAARVIDNGDGTHMPVVASGAGEDHIGQVGGTTKIATAGINRPADVIPYAVGDLIGAVAAADASNVLTLAAARINGGSGRIIRVRGFTSDPDCVATVRVHFLKLLVVPTVGDNAPILKSVAGYMHGYGYADLSFSAGAKGYAANVPAIAFDVEAATSNIYALLEARTAFTPKSGQRFGVSLELDLD